MSSPASATTGPCRVLVVDDDDDTAHTMVELLEIEGHVAASRSGLTALLASPLPWSPDVVFSDFHLSDLGGNGLMVLRHARREWAQARLALVSGLEPAVLKGMMPAALGTVAQFRKPLDVDVLLRFVRD